MIRGDATRGEQFLRASEPRECPACWGNGYTLDRHEEKLPCSICAETGKVVPFVPSETAAPDLDEIRDQCRLGLQVEHDCPAMFALAAIYAELLPDAAPQTPQAVRPGTGDVQSATLDSLTPVAISAGAAPGSAGWEPQSSLPSAIVAKDQAAIDFEEAARDHIDAERYRWLRDQCDAERRIEIAEYSDKPHLLDHHIDKGLSGL